MLDRALAFSPHSGSAHYLRGQLLHQLHREPEAHAEFAKAATLLAQFNDDLQHGNGALHQADAGQICNGAHL